MSMWITSGNLLILSLNLTEFSCFINRNNNGANLLAFLKDPMINIHKALRVGLAHNASNVTTTVIKK